MSSFPFCVFCLFLCKRGLRSDNSELLVDVRPCCSLVENIQNPDRVHRRIWSCSPFTKHVVHYITWMSVKALDIVGPTKETWDTHQNTRLLSQQIVGFLLWLIFILGDLIPTSLYFFSCLHVGMSYSKVPKVLLSQRDHLFSFSLILQASFSVNK